MLSYRSHRSLRKPALVILAVSAAGAFIGVPLLSHDGASFAQDAVEQGQHPAKKPAPKPVRKDKAEAVEKPAPAQPAPAPAPDFAGRLTESGAGTCAAQINNLAAGTMGTVAQFNTASNWAKGAADKRVVSVSIGQKYPDRSAIPFAATNIVAAPNPQGTCDAFAFQVIPSPHSCSKLRDTLASANGRQVADLAGVPLMQDGGGQTLLIPTAAETCVVVGVRMAFAN